jgi:hypothetical protein
MQRLNQKKVDRVKGFAGMVAVSQVYPIRSAREVIDSETSGSSRRLDKKINHF